jgi:hypothetical protein
MEQNKAVVKPLHKALLVGVVLVGSMSQAFALDPAVEAAFTAVSTDVDAMGDLTWPIVIAVTLISVSIGLFKKFITKAAS